MKQSIHSNINSDDDGFICYSNELFLTKTFLFTDPHLEKITVTMKTNNDVTVRSMRVMLKNAKVFPSHSDTELYGSEDPVDEKEAVGKLITFFGLNVTDIDKDKAKSDALLKQKAIIEGEIKKYQSLISKWTDGSNPQPPITPDDKIYYKYYNDLLTEWKTALSVLQLPDDGKTSDDVKNTYHNDLNVRFKLFAGTEFWDGVLKRVKLLRFGVNSDDLRFEFLGRAKKWIAVDGEIYADGSSKMKRSDVDIVFPFVVYYPILRFRLVLILEVVG
jgi:hypothetical protein